MKLILISTLSIVLFQINALSQSNFYQNVIRIIANLVNGTYTAILISDGVATDAKLIIKQ